MLLQGLSASGLLGNLKVWGVKWRSWLRTQYQELDLLPQSVTLAELKVTHGRMEQAREMCSCFPNIPLTHRSNWIKKVCE